MSLLYPRSAYRRADSDDADFRESTLELSSVNTTYSSSSATKRPLLDPVVETEPIPFPRSPHHRLFRQSHRRDPHEFHGWRVGALSAAALALTSLLINIAVASWLGSHGVGAGLVEVFKGSCAKVQQMDIWTHLGINALSTLLLGGSNYCMQCLCAPTRNDVDRAHSRGQWLDIGVPSIRNLDNVSKSRAALWWMLGLSSIPLHLMYNSAFFKSLSTNDYDLYIVTPDFIEGAGFVANASIIAPSTFAAEGIIPVNASDIQNAILETDGFERLGPTECINAYATNFVSDRRNLVLVSKEVSNNSLLLIAQYRYSKAVESEFGKYLLFDWICTSDSGIDNKISIPGYDKSQPSLYKPPCGTYISQILTLADQGDWTPWGHDVEFCLSERVPETCSYSGNIPIIIVVIVCNGLKIIGMLIVAFGLQDNPLITVGDAVQSFLTHPDTKTKGICLLSKKDVTDDKWPHPSIKEKSSSAYRPDPIPVTTLSSPWGRAASTRRWVLTIALILCALFLISGFLAMAVNAISTTGLTILSLGLGRVDGGAIIKGWSVGTEGSAAARITGNILIANLPQAILSFLYLHLNGLLTTMFLAAEYADFSAADGQKGLRVSRPKPGTAQRSSYFLQLPYRIAIPLMILSGLLHWLVSQSIFLAVVAEYFSTGEIDSPVAVASCGFSPLSMILVLCLGGFIVIVTAAMGILRRYNATPSLENSLTDGVKATKAGTGMPLAGSCSAAISAACHPPHWDNDAALKPVRWGVIPGSEDVVMGVAHCSFTSGDVDSVKMGKLYAG